MSTVDVTNGVGKRAAVDAAAIDKLKSALRGQLLRPGDSGYDDARTIWNAMIDRKPALIAMCTNTADVKLAVDFAREHELLTAIHGGGHNIAGNAVCDGGFMINLSLINAVKVDPKAQTASAGPGATLGDFDAATLKHGLATPVGINSTTGIAGLTLGGGFGWLSRKYGLTVDNVTGVEIVTADGQVIEANESSHP
ncbi:MAG: FAD-dependent oxidoreductase, partial [bacterium]